MQYLVNLQLIIKEAKAMKKQKEFWEYRGMKMCSLSGVQTLAEQICGQRPARSTVQRWLSSGLMYYTYIGCHYVFRVDTVENYLLKRNKPREQYSYRKEAI